MPSRSNSPCSTSTVARASASARWLGSVRGAEERRERGQLAVGHLVAGEHAAGQLGGVDRPRGRPGAAVPLAGGLEEADVEGGVVGDQDAAAGELQERPAAPPRSSARRDHHRSVMPVSTADERRDRCPGSTSVWNSPSTSPPRTLTAPISVIALSFGGAAGGLQVDDDEGDVGQRSTQVLDGHLCTVDDRAGGLAGSGRDGRGHGADGKSHR